LLRILGERDVPGRTGTACLLGNEPFLYIGPVRFEDLDTIIGAIADIQQTIDGKIGTVHGIAELWSGRRVGVVRSKIGVIRLVSVGAPVPFVCAGISVKNN